MDPSGVPMSHEELLGCAPEMLDIFLQTVNIIRDNQNPINSVQNPRKATKMEIYHCLVFIFDVLVN